MPIYNFDARPDIFNELENLSKEKKINILDIGCGQGHFIQNFKDFNADKWGIEPIEKFQDEASPHFDTLLKLPVEEAIEKLPLDYFDYIFLNDVLEHLYYPEKVLESLKKHLKKDGVIVSSIPNVRFIENLKEVFLKKDWEYKDQGILDDTHIRFFTEKSILRMWQKLNFNVLKFKGINKRVVKKPFMKTLLKITNNEDTLYLQFLSIVSKN